MAESTYDPFSGREIEHYYYPKWTMDINELYKDLSSQYDGMPVANQVTLSDDGQKIHVSFPSLGIVFYLSPKENQTWLMEAWVASFVNMDEIYDYFPSSRERDLDIETRLLTLAFLKSTTTPVERFIHKPEARPLEAHEAWLDGASATDQVILQMNAAAHQLTLEKPIEKLLTAIPSMEVEHYGGAIPFQSEGKIGDAYYYFRFRGGSASLSLAPDTKLENLYAKSRQQLGGKYDGVLTLNQFMDYFVLLYNSLVPVQENFDVTPYKVEGWINEAIPLPDDDFDISDYRNR